MAPVIILTNEKKTILNENCVAKILRQLFSLSLILRENVGISEVMKQTVLLEKKTPTSMASSTNKINSYHIGLFMPALHGKDTVQWLNSWPDI